jgi:hypothetical protein
MIRPTKYMDLTVNILAIATEILSELERTHIVSLEELDAQIQARINEKARINFIPSLNLLYILGCLDYDSETDAVVYLRNSGGDR